MKRITLTDQQYAMLMAFFDSETIATDMVQDALGDASREALGHPIEFNRSDEMFELEMDLQNSLQDAFAAAVDVKETGQ